MIQSTNPLSYKDSLGSTLNIKQGILYVNNFNSLTSYEKDWSGIYRDQERKSGIQMPFRQDWTHHYVIVHGGAIAFLGDSAVAMPLIRWVEPGGGITTIVLKINVLYP